MAQNRFKSFLGVAAGLPFQPDDPFRISVSIFAKYDQAEYDAIQKVSDSGVRTAKLQSLIRSAILKADPILAKALYSNELEAAEVTAFFGDPEEELEEFIDENGDEIGAALEERDLSLIGGLTFSRFPEGETGLTKDSRVSTLLDHLEENYFLVDHISDS